MMVNVSGVYQFGEFFYYISSTDYVEGQLLKGETKARAVTIYMGKTYREAGYDLFLVSKQYALKLMMSLSGHLPSRIRGIRKSK